MLIHISNLDLSLLSRYLFILDKQISGLRVDNQHHSVRRTAKYTIRENATTMTGKKLASFLEIK
jgi:hypothetical protein